MVLAYDLLKDRRTIDVNITKFFPQWFKMAESFQNLGNILRWWAKYKVQKRLAEAFNRSEKQDEERYSRFSLEQDSEEIVEQSQSAVVNKNKYKIGVDKPRTIALSQI